MELELHPEAAANLSTKAETLLRELRIMTPEARPQGFRPERVISHTVRPEDILDIKLGSVDASGRPVGKYFTHRGNVVGPQGEAYRALSLLAEEFHVAKSFRDTVSTSFLRDRIFEWLENRHKQVPLPRLTDYVTEKAAGAIRGFEVWTPIASLFVQSSFQLGHVTFQTFAAEHVEGWGRDLLGGREADSQHVDDWVLRERKRLQGRAAAVVSLRAEPQRARELALEYTEETIALLRMIGPWHLDPDWVSYCTVMGKERIERPIQVLMADGRLYQFHEGITVGRVDWALEDEALALCNQYLEVFNQLLLAESRTPYQDKLLHALRLYSESSLAKRVSDKLVYIWAALESFLLRNSTEPVQDRIGDRMAFFLETTGPARAQIIKSVRAVYGQRSRFLHHGQSIDELEETRVFMRFVFKFFLQAIDNAHRFHRVDDLLDAIERVRLS